MRLKLADAPNRFQGVVTEARMPDHAAGGSSCHLSAIHHSRISRLIARR